MPGRASQSSGKTRGENSEQREGKRDAEARGAAAARSVPLSHVRSLPGLPEGQRIEAARELQRMAGNRAVSRLFVQERSRPSVPSEGQPVEMLDKDAALASGETNEFGEITGTLDSDVEPHLFVSGGKTGVGPVNWIGGDGGQGNQTTGSVAVVGPFYEAVSPASKSEKAKAWVRPGTGTATVTRSYKGVQVGANGAYYFTAGAAARADVHEQLHVTSSQTLHNTHISPLETRVGQHKSKETALASGTTQAEAIAALKTFVNWNPSLTSFRTSDTAANTPMGTTDTTDMASPTFIRNYGPRKVGGVDYANYIDVPPGPS